MKYLILLLLLITANFALADSRLSESEQAEVAANLDSLLERIRKLEHYHEQSATVYPNAIPSTSREVLLAATKRVSLANCTMGSEMPNKRWTYSVDKNVLATAILEVKNQDVIVCEMLRDPK
tara:strand:+ start:23889 stop:24254 length:366 start_codon:yes stop_codon:yes gene_type:complete